MSLRLPASDSPLRELFDVADLARVTVPEGRGDLHPYRHVVDTCVTHMEGDPAIRSVNAIAYRSDSEVWLIRVGRKGGVKRLWNFGKLQGPQAPAAATAGEWESEGKAHV